MALGRAQKLKWMLLRNFPRTEEDELDWSIFEKGPPDFLVEFLDALDVRAKKTWPKLERAQRQLGMPAWRDVPICDPDPSNKERYLYDRSSSLGKASWGKLGAIAVEAAHWQEA